MVPKVRRSSNSSNEGPQEQQGCAAKGSKFNLAHGCEACFARFRFAIKFGEGAKQGALAKVAQQIKRARSGARLGAQRKAAN
jgi:hypothetical protein